MQEQITPSDRQKFKKVSKKTLSAFFFSLLLCSTLIGITIRNRSHIEEMTMERLIMEKSTKVTEVISKLLYKTQALAALAIQSDGEMDDFERVATTIVDDPAILNILVAPSGTVSNVYPLEGNEKLIGYNLLGKGDGNREALMAKEMNQLVFGGPFTLMQGGEALVGRLPVWMNVSGDKKFFWGLVSVTLKYPQALEGAGLAILEKEGFAYEIWRVNPDDEERQIIAHSDYHYNKNARFIEKHTPILNADWYFRLSPVLEWYQYPENWILIFIGFGISFLIAFIVQNNCELKLVKTELENMVRIDALTGLYNRKGLFYELGKLIDMGKAFELHYIDLNYFKQINDTYGHNIGDEVLIKFSRKIEKYAKGMDIFARISGDEFVLIRICGDASPESAYTFWENIDRAFSDAILKGPDGDVFLSFSRGTAVFPNDGKNADEIISCADLRMYQEKNKRYATEKKRRHTDIRPQISH